MRRTNHIYILGFLGIVGALGTAACTSENRPENQTPSENAVENYTPEISTEENGYDGFTATDKSADIVVPDDETYWENTDFGTTVIVTYSGSSAEVTSDDGTIVSYINGADVAIDLSDVGAAEIIAEGTSEDGQLKIYGNSAVKLTLNGLKLTSGKSAAINVQNKSFLYLHLNDGTENTICDSEDRTDESYYPEGVEEGDEKRNGAIYCKGSLVLSGNGILEITGKKKHGVSVKSSFTIRPGATLAINDVADNCIKAEGITVLGGYIWAKTSADAGKCLSSDARLDIKGGIVKLYTTGGSVYEEDENDKSSPAGMKVDGDMTVSGGEIICISDGSEGLESKSKITINGGEIFVYAYDDAINVGGDSPIGMEINGGKIFAFADNNDGIDSNGKLWINGGLVIASGSATPEEGFDCDSSQNFIVTGGTLIGTGGAAISTSSSSTQRSVIYNGLTAKTGELIVIADEDGNPILKYEMPRTMNTMALFFSVPEIISGKTYTVYSGGTLSGNTTNWNGWFKDGTYNAGTELGSFTSDNLTTIIGNSGSGFPGGPGAGDSGIGGPGAPGNGGSGNGGWGPGWWN